MDIEKLTKSQIVLLTLLVSFVTSIATGIVTVSLMQQAPPVVAQTVNRIIEHTVQTVATSTSRAQPAAAVVTQQKTVIVNESDLVAQAVKQANPSMVQVFSSTADADDSVFLGLGVVLTSSGEVVSDIGALGDRPEAQVVLPDGTRVREFVTKRDPASGLLYLKPATSTDQKMPTWTPASLASIDPALGSSVVALSGKGTLQIGVGFVTVVIPKDASGPEVIETDVPSSSIMFGSPLITTDGKVVGVSTGVSRASHASGFIPASLLSP